MPSHTLIQALVPPLLSALSPPAQVNRVRNMWAHFTWVDSFNLGGLAGIPFTGKTGFAAFHSHMPEDGGLFILYASHVGVSSQGKVYTCRYTPTSHS